jgi:sec-independent protein translocase protein TatB
MKIFNIGPLELVFILIVALLILGPKDMVKTGAQLGKFVRKVIKSPIWHSIVSISNEIRDIPRKIVTDTGLDEEIKEFEQESRKIENDLRKDVDSISGDLKKVMRITLPENQPHPNEVSKQDEKNNNQY